MLAQHTFRRLVAPHPSSSMTSRNNQSAGFMSARELERLRVTLHLYRGGGDFRVISPLQTSVSVYHFNVGPLVESLQRIFMHT